MMTILQLTWTNEHQDFVPRGESVYRIVLDDQDPNLEPKFEQLGKDAAGDPCWLALDTIIEFKWTLAYHAMRRFAEVSHPLPRARDASGRITINIGRFVNGVLVEAA